jgi:hypothetical protein
VHGLAVVGEAERTGLRELGHLRQRLAVQLARDRGHEADGDARLAACRLAQGAQERRGVHHRVGVGHRDDGDVAAGRGRAGARVEVLLVLLTRRAQVHVRVDEAGEQVPPLAVEDLGAVGRVEAVRCADLGDHAASDQHVVRGVDALARVQHVRGAHEQVRGRLGAVVEPAHAPAPTVTPLRSGAVRPASSS